MRSGLQMASGALGVSGCLLGASWVPSGCLQMAPDVYTPWVLVGGYLESGKWLDTVDKMCLKYLENVSKTFHPLCPANDLPIYHCAIHNSGVPPKGHPRCCEGSEDRLHNGGWRDKLLDTWDETFFKTFCNYFKHGSSTLSSHLPPSRYILTHYPTSHNQGSEPS